MNPLDQSKWMLKRAGVRITQHRSVVMEYLLREAKPVCHADLVVALRAHELERVTLYRILAKLCDVGLVHRVQGSDGTWRYCAHDLCSDFCPGGHPHFLCERCATMICIAEHRLPKVELPEGYEVHSKQMLLQGICAQCRAVE